MEKKDMLMLFFMLLTFVAYTDPNEYFFIL